MDSSVMTRWLVPADDWVSSIAVIEDKLIAYGTRDGHIGLTNWYGVKLCDTQVGGWIGALKLVPIRSKNAAVIIAGTKDGRIELYGYGKCFGENLNKLSSYNVNNTVRDIDIINASGQSEKIIVGVGSEDKHIYQFELDLNNPNTEIEPTSASPNGWIRTVEYAYNPITDKYVLAAGCGDKNIYFYSVDSNYINKVNIDSKVHWLLSNKRSPEIYGVTDRHFFFRIHPVFGNEYKVDTLIELPHRPIRICFFDAHNEKVLVACENGWLYLYDPSQGAFISENNISDQIVDVCQTGSKIGSSVLIGTGTGFLKAISILRYKTPEINTSFVKPSLAKETDLSKFGNLATHIMQGPKNGRLLTGIGRFIHLVNGINSSEQYCSIATDEGRLFLLRIQNSLDDEDLILAEEFKNRRLWAVYCFFDQSDPDILNIYLASSEKEIIHGQVNIKSPTPEWKEIDIILLEDWPREIRPVSNSDADDIVACCEDGSIVFTKRKECNFKVEQVFRTLYAKREEGHIHVIAGSDNNQITYYIDGVLLWKFNTKDRVRETLIFENYCYCVSEDRFLYVLNLQGKLIWSFKTPHRALCVEPIKSENQITVLVGCGDGKVYEVTEAGYIINAFKFPDRIRDLRVTNNGEFIVSSEDGYAYLTCFPETFIGNSYSGILPKTLQQEVSKIRDAILFEEKELTYNLNDETIFFLLKYFRLWIDTPKQDLFLVLVDMAINCLTHKTELEFNYIIADCIHYSFTRIDPAVARAQVRNFTTSIQSEYPSHALISICRKNPFTFASVIEEEIENKLYFEEITFENIILNSEWVKIEFSRHLYSICTDDNDSIFNLFKSIRYSFLRIDTILKSLEHQTEAHILENSNISSTAILNLLQIYKIANGEQQALLGIIHKSTTGIGDDIVIKCIEIAKVVFLEEKETTESKVRFLESTIQSLKITENLKTYLLELIDLFSEINLLTEKKHTVVNIINLYLREINFKISLSEYLICRVIQMSIIQINKRG